MCPVELRDEQLQGALLIRCRAERLEPPSRMDRIIGSARTRFERQFCDLTVSRLPDGCARRLEELVAGGGAGRGGLLAELKADPGQVSLDTLLREIEKLEAVKALQLPPGLFADCSERLVARADKKVERELTDDLRRSAARKGSCSGLPRRRSTAPMTRCARPCSLWSGRARCGNWSTRRRSSVPTRSGSARRRLLDVVVGARTVA